MKNTALTVSGLFFTLIALLHFVRYFKAWPVVFNQFSIPLTWSIYAGVVLSLLALWMVIAANKK